ncbi:MAG: hypothetical protein WAO91_08825 [Candidatus Nitrosotenuis sp.]
MNILNILNEKGPHPFNELQRLTNYVPSTLSSLLDELEEVERNIEKIPHKGKIAYGITKKGKDTILEFGILGMTAMQIMRQGGSYHDDYSSRFSKMSYYYELPWGIQDDITYDKTLKKILPISEQTADSVHKFLYNCIKEDIKSGKIQLDSTKDGKIILGFMIDYADLVKSFNEQSLYHLENMSEKERDLFHRIGDRTMTEKEREELAELRKQEKAKRGVRLR